MTRFIFSTVAALALLGAVASPSLATEHMATGDAAGSAMEAPHADGKTAHKKHHAKKHHKKEHHHKKMEHEQKM